jgi:hypothetical protein
MRVLIQLLALEHCWSISTGSCLTILLTALISLRTCLPTYWLRSQNFNNIEELMEGVKTWLNSQVADFFDTGIQKLILRYNTCFSSGGDYVER